MATRKRAHKPDGTFSPDDPSTPHTNEAYQQPASPDLPISVDSLAAFMRIDHPDRQRLDTALTLARTAAERFIGRPIRKAEPHSIRHGIHLLSAHLLVLDQLQEVPTTTEIPLTVRGFWRANAGHQPI